jgi:hypothetical protein
VCTRRTSGIFHAFIEERLDAPKHLAKDVWHNWQEPAYDDFRPRTVYSLNNAFSSAIGTLEPVPRYKATASLGRFFTQN